MLTLRLIRYPLVILIFFALTGGDCFDLRADGPQDNIADNVRRIPKAGIKVPAEKREQFEFELRALAEAISDLQKKTDARTRELLPDVQIYHKAVHDALKYDEFFDPAEITTAIELLIEGRTRAEQLARGEAPWTTATGLVPRGYVSRIDGSVQPYGLVVPANYTATGSGKFRLDLWFHGRGETLSEMNFLQQRRKQAGTFTPADTIVLHPYGRYCNANKFAGEIDALEGLESVQRRYRIDPNRISVRGFSMGGAAAWHFAVHYADRWFAANPGAGFSETPQFLNVFQKETLQPTWYEQKLWRWYDCNEWARNLFHCPTVAYSGDQDSQKQAADVMAEALAKEGIELTHIIGPETKHSYHPGARDEVERRMASLAGGGRRRVPAELYFVTYTLRYHRMHWLSVDGLEEHWERAEVAGRLLADGIQLTTKNVTAVTIDFLPGEFPFVGLSAPKLAIDGQDVPTRPMASDRSWTISAHRVEGTWRAGPLDEPLRKRPGLQGPVDDAFMDSFVFVRPTGKAASDEVEQWVQAELDRAIEHWRRHFRGEARVKKDAEVTEEDIRSSNLVLWGTAESNQLLGKIAGSLPIRADGTVYRLGDQSLPAEHHVPILIYPNPLNPARYVVLNSSFTFRDYAYLNNARQVPKLPDWALIDVRTKPNAIWPGKVVAADFFDEQWQLRGPGAR